jgi:hypothetical protein
MRVVGKIEKLLRDLPTGRRVVTLEESLRRARQDVQGEREMWKQAAREDLSTDVDFG